MNGSRTMKGKPPDLTKLVEEYGGYRCIPTAAWAQYDRDVAEWRAGVISGWLWMEQWLERHPADKAVAEATPEAPQMPIAAMTQDDISAELRAGAEGPLPRSDAETKRRIGLWRRLDEIVRDNVIANMVSRK